MSLRFLICFLAVGCGANFASAQQLPIVNSISTSGRQQEWKVSYDRSENWTSLPFKKRPKPATRLQITTDGVKYYGQLWMYDFAPSGTGYIFFGRTDKFELTIEGDSTGRNRIGFEAKKVDLLILGATKKINVHGVWQYGRDKSNRNGQRIQLKINHAPSIRPEAGGNCDEDPDTDVLEEGEPPTNPDDPPTEP